MRVAIDPKVCAGHGLCYVDASAVFVDDEYGHGQIIGDGTVPETHAEATRHAVDNCPEGAITVIGTRTVTPRTSAN